MDGLDVQLDELICDVHEVQLAPGGGQAGAAPRAHRILARRAGHPDHPRLLMGGRRGATVGGGGGGDGRAVAEQVTGARQWRLQGGVRVHGRQGLVGVPGPAQHPAGVERP